MIGKEKGNFVVTTTMSKANQITVPSVVRKMMGLEPGDGVEFVTDEDGVRLVKALTKEERIKEGLAKLEAWREDMSDETKELIKKHAGWTVNQYHEYYDNLPETKKYIEEKYGVKVA